MRKLVLIILAILLITTNVLAGSVTLEWAPNTEPDLVGYKVYTRTNTNDSHTLLEDIPCTNLTDINDPTYTNTNLPDGVFNYFVVTAYDSEGLESEFSNEVVCSDGLPPTKVGILGITCN